MSDLLKEIHKEAPNILISLRPTLGDLPKQDLENGRVDLAVAGFYEKMPEGFYKSLLFKDQFATAYRKNSSLFKGSISKDEFFDAEHALITLQGDFSDDMEQTFRGKKRGRKIVYGSSSFTGLAWVLAKSDLLLTAPKILLNKYEEYFPLNVVNCPVDIDPISIQMVWHQQSHQDPLKSWFRQKLKSVCAALD